MSINKLVAPSELDRRYSHMWDGSEPGWAISSSGDPLRNGIPINTVEHGMFIMDDDEVAKYVIRKMLAAGCPVFNGLPWFPKRRRWWWPPDWFSRVKEEGNGN